MATKSKFVIIGAGPTGLGAAYRLRELGEEDFIVLDRAGHVGGLSSSFRDAKGFTWDIGGHVQFSHYGYFDDVMAKALGRDGWLHHQRESWVWIKNRFVPYPFQNNIRYLPKMAMWKCLEGIIRLYRNPPLLPPKNFHEWIHATFGEGIAQEFMIPYNFKVWAYPADQMAHSWVGERVAVTDLLRVAENILFEKDDLSWGPNTTFQFPKRGGTGGIWNAVGKLVGESHLRLQCEAVRIFPERKSVMLAGGEEIEFEHLLSTMPLDLLAQKVDGFPESLRDQAGRLMHSSSNIVGIGLRGKPKPELGKKCWMYFPEDNCPFYRVTVFSNYSPYNVPDIAENWSLMAEISESPFKPVDRENLVADTIQGLLNTSLIEKEGDIVSTHVIRADYGYPTPSVERDAILQAVVPELEKRGIFSRGRFGAWKYEVSNQDHSFMQGVEWSNSVRLGTPETTVRFSGAVDSKGGRS